MTRRVSRAVAASLFLPGRVLNVRIAAVIGTVAGLALLGLAGCGQFNFERDLPITLEDLNAIRSDTSLEPEEKRAALEELGIDPVVINGLLRDERLANQFGGSLTTAYEKVVGDRFSDLTPDEIQFYAQTAADITYSDAEAQVIRNFFADTAINDAPSLEAFLDDSTSFLDPDIDGENLRAVFVDADPDDVLLELP